MTHQDDLISEVQALRTAVAALAARVRRLPQLPASTECQCDLDDVAVMDAIKASPEGCARSALSRSTQALGAQRRDAAVARLVAAQRVTVESIPTDGRPATILHPVTPVTCAGDQRLTAA